MTWSNQSKDWDADRPIHRIDATTPTSYHADGHGFTKPGYKCARLPGHVRDKILRMVPNWVSVLDDQQIHANRFVAKELEGVVEGSFQSWNDTPCFQWHRAYDWNFHIRPSDGYEYLMGDGNLYEESGQWKRSSAIECEWDTGAFGKKSQGKHFGPGPMFDYDWAWPMAGQYMWLCGRWIYDCGHPEGPNKDLMKTELHPCKAIATARWEAVKLQRAKIIWTPPETATGPLYIDTPYYIPGIQFMFFASRFGGYFDYPGSCIRDQDYKFIVDLPRISKQTTTAHIAPTDEIPLNTVVVNNPKLVVKFENAQFTAGAEGNNGWVEPEITPIPLAGGIPPQQAIVNIPLSKIPGPLPDNYGVIVSFGWYDPANELAKRVVQCTITLDHIEIRGPSDFLRELELKFGVNGRWHRKECSGSGNFTVDLKKSFDFWLSRDHPTQQRGGIIRINAHGTHIMPVGRYFRGDEHQRTLIDPTTHLGYRFFEDVEAGDDKKRLEVAESLWIALATTLKFENTRIWPADDSGGVEQFAPFPSTVKRTLFKNDYTLHFEIQMTKQSVP